ncbi:MAG: transposase [Verrucomicrobiaceae bacterium]
MRKSRWLAPWKDDPEKPVIYHVVSRIVDRRFVLGDEEREHFKMLMRMYENFSGCRVLSYCIMSNHFHILLEVPPTPSPGETLEDLSDSTFFKRLDALYSRAFVQGIRHELAHHRSAEADARKALSAGKISQKSYHQTLLQLQQVKGRFTYRMHDLSQFMKGLLQRFTSWYNRMNGRKGTLWEQRFKSVIVEDGTASRTMAAYIDLNPVRAGMVADPADYRWSSYGEAAAGGKKARAGLVRALHGHRGNQGKPRAWAQGGIAKEYRTILLQGAVEVKTTRPDSSGDISQKTTRKGAPRAAIEKELARLKKADPTPDLAIGKAISCRIRYFADGAVLGSKTFVNDVYQQSREHFGTRRQTGARKPRGTLGHLAGQIWTARDLQTEIH